MRLYEHTMPGGARLVGYLRDLSESMADYNTRPAILILPGGGYSCCSDREADPVAMNFLNAGYQVFTLYYTVAESTQPPLEYAPLLDALRAVRHIRQNAAALCVVPQKIAVCGFSAGGHLAASTAILCKDPVLDAQPEAPFDDAMPNAVILGYPVITSGAHGHQGSFDNLAGDNETLRRSFSLEHRAAPGLPPFFLWHTVEDELVPVQNSLLLAQALGDCGVPYEMHLFTHGSHGSSTCTNEVGTPNAHNAAWMALCQSWLSGVFSYAI